MMVATVLMMFAVSVASADVKPAPAPVAKAPATTPLKAKSAEQLVTDDCARATKLGKQCVVNMDADQVGGTTPTGTGLGVTVISPTKQPSLIRLRKDFIAEMIKTTEDL